MIPFEPSSENEIALVSAYNKEIEEDRYPPRLTLVFVSGNSVCGLEESEIA